MKGIILAGGAGTRLYPLTNVTSKQLLPIYDKPMIYYPLATLMEAGIKDILIITTSGDLANFVKLLKDGSHLGININYKVQPSPDGLAQAFILGEHFIGKENVCLILGDNIFYDSNLKDRLLNAAALKKGATVFGYKVPDPQRFGVIEFDKEGRAISIEEKPQEPKSNYCVTGLYFYDNDVIRYAKSLKPSKRNELEITDLNNIYLQQGLLQVQLLDDEAKWLDAGTHDSLVEATLFIKEQEEKEKRKIACLEEIAYLNGWINQGQLEKLICNMGNTSYKTYVKKILK